MTLTEFLLARIAEDGELASEVDRLDGADWWVDGPGAVSAKFWVYATGEKFKHREVAEHVARYDPRRVLAECEAKRRIVENLRDAIPSPDESWQGWKAASLSACQFLALPYADHPDYRDEWKP